jgi:MFS family permease
VGQTVSQFGDKLHHMALIALVGAEAAVETSGIALAQLSVVFTLPLIFGPLAGALVDRWNKRLTMIVCDGIRAVIVAMIPWLYRETGHLWPVYIVAFFVFLLGVFFNAAKMALIPDLVGNTQLMAANAALTSIGRFATIFGIVGGGVIIGWGIWSRIGWTGYQAGFYIDALSYLVSVGTLVVIALLSAAHARRNAGAFSAPEAAELVRRELQHISADMRQTLGLIRRHRDLRFVFITVILLAFMAASLFVVVTPLVQSVMGAGPQGVGYLGGLLAGGMAVGSLAIGSLGSSWNRRHIVLIGFLVLGALMLVGAWRYSFTALIPVAFLAGLVLAPAMVSQDTLLHEAAPQGARGLIFSTRDLLLGLAFMAAALAVGWLTRLLGILGHPQPFRLALFGVGVLIIGAAAGGEISVLRAARAADSGTRSAENP